MSIKLLNGGTPTPFPGGAIFKDSFENVTSGTPALDISSIDISTPTAPVLNFASNPNLDSVFHTGSPNAFGVLISGAVGVPDINGFHKGIAGTSSSVTIDFDGTGAGYTGGQILYTRWNDNTNTVFESLMDINLINIDDVDRTNTYAVTSDGIYLADKHGNLYNADTAIGTPYTPLTKNGGCVFEYNNVSGANLTAKHTWEMESSNTGYQEMWCRVVLRIPTETSFGCRNGTTTNQHKFAIFYQDDYNQFGDGSTVFFELYGELGTDKALMGVTHTLGGSTGALGNPIAKAEVFDCGTDKGKWIEFVYQMKCESSDGADDGLYRAYTRIGTTSALSAGSWTLSQEVLNVGIKSSTVDGITGFHGGYFFGPSNPGYTTDESEKIAWLQDVWELSETDIWGAS
ncbi:MAG: hypothetical protein GY776_00350 [Alteromonas sp.]|nr:hypothetical protein [Alteromonas sp.]